MKLCDDRYYFVFPAYGPEFQGMGPWLADWENHFQGMHRFWPGFAGGGVLAVPMSVPARQRNALALGTKNCHHKPVYGMVLGNAGGQRLAGCVSCALGDRPPAFAVRMGLAEREPEPKVKATAEHVESLGDGRLLLVVPRPKRKAMGSIDRLPEWFATFGVVVDPSLLTLPNELRAEMADWFGDPSRPMFAFRMSGGEDNAAWQTAVVYYVAEHWDTTVPGLDSVHVVSAIEEVPCFRRNWTSNK